MKLPQSNDTIMSILKETQSVAKSQIHELKTRSLQLSQIPLPLTVQRIGIPNLIDQQPIPILFSSFECP